MLAEARELLRTGGRLLLVTGAPAEFDSLTRVALGQAAVAADQVIVTADNPRRESAAALAAQMMSGGTASRFVFEPERDRAIRTAIRLAQPGDVVVIAGKGHRRVQEIGGAMLPCDDRPTAFKALAGLGYANESVPM
jgi:UDP-N-acetylmuramyl tripeptide synthase